MYKLVCHVKVGVSCTSGRVHVIITLVLLYKSESSSHKYHLTMIHLPPINIYITSYYKHGVFTYLDQPHMLVLGYLLREEGVVMIKGCGHGRMGVAQGVYYVFIYLRILCM